MCQICEQLNIQTMTKLFHVFAIQQTVCLKSEKSACMFHYVHEFFFVIFFDWLVVYAYTLFWSDCLCSFLKKVFGMNPKKQICHAVYHLILQYGLNRRQKSPHDCLCAWRRSVFVLFTAFCLLFPLAVFCSLSFARCLLLAVFCPNQISQGR